MRIQHRVGLAVASFLLYCGGVVQGVVTFLYWPVAPNVLFAGLMALSTGVLLGVGAALAYLACKGVWARGAEAEAEELAHSPSAA